jgi:Flp pilus assembly protein TadG
MMLYVGVVLPALFAVLSLAVDLGRAQLVKLELQRSADATARGYIAVRINKGDDTAKTVGPKIADMNPVDGNAMAPTVTVTRGYWNATTKNFNEGNGIPFAVKVTVSRKAANSNAVPLMWGALIGKSSVDVQATAIAVLNSQPGQEFEVSAQGDPWLSGMPAGSLASYNDYAGTDPDSSDPKKRKQSPKQITIPVIPGSYITFSKIEGDAAHGPTLGHYDPEGETANIFTHGADSPNGGTPAAENGIGDVKMPIGAFMGVFLNDNRPDSTSAPTQVRDYSSTSSRQKEFYDDIKAKQPFYIGDGMTGSGSGKVQKFKVPSGVTRLFVGMMDGHEWSNNVGSFSVTTATVESVELVQ